MADADIEPAGHAATDRCRYDVKPGGSAVLIRARSNVGPIELGSTQVSGWADAFVRDGRVDTEHPADASIRLPVVSLSSGKPLYDNEIHRRLDAQRFPTITARLAQCQASPPDGLTMAGMLTIHGESRELTGFATIERFDEEVIIIGGEQSIDIRDFSISLLTALMMRIYPDVVVQFRIECERMSGEIAPAEMD